MKHQITLMRVIGSLIIGAFVLSACGPTTSSPRSHRYSSSMYWHDYYYPRPPIDVVPPTPIEPPIGVVPPIEIEPPIAVPYDGGFGGGDFGGGDFGGGDFGGGDFGGGDF